MEMRTSVGRGARNAESESASDHAKEGIEAMRKEKKETKTWREDTSAAREGERSRYTLRSVNRVCGWGGVGMVENNGRVHNAKAAATKRKRKNKHKCD